MDDYPEHWDVVRNGPGDPPSRGSHRIAWWVHTACGYQWQRAVRDQLRRGLCSACSNTVLVIGRNDLATTHPQLAAEWSHERNSCPPEQVTAGSSKKAWWRDRFGHEWQATPAMRSTGTGCPFCARKQVLAGFNDLATTHPEVVDQWHEDNDRAPSDILSGNSRYVARWRGACGHEWQASAIAHLSRGAQCPFCHGRSVLAGFNDLATTHPQVAREWHPDRNDLSATDVSAGSNRQVWWRCARGHEWHTWIANRTRLRAGCAVCSNRRVVLGENDLAKTHPQVASEWHPTRNETTASEIVAGSNSQAWWICQSGHEWRTRVVQRTRSGTGCPYCAGQRVLTGTNDLLSQRPLVAEQWHPDNELRPDQVAYASHQKAKWQCPAKSAHAWYASISMRTGTDLSHQTGCPQCSAQFTASRSEREMVQFLRELGAHVVESHRGLRKEGITELDAYLPDHALAVEFNGLYWHSERFKDPGYHQRKWADCQRLGIRLLQIWEDDWKTRPGLVKLQLAEEIARTNASPLHARSPQTCNLDVQQAREFLDEHHLRGFAAGRHRFALKDSTRQILACAVFRHRDAQTLELVRYAQVRRVEGGLETLIRKAAGLGYERLIACSDNCTSESLALEQVGFTRTGSVAAAYTYLVNGRRVNRSGYRRRRFQSDPILQYEEGFTERQLAELNGLLRVYDSGATRWERALSAASMP